MKKICIAVIGIIFTVTAFTQSTNVNNKMEQRFTVLTLGVDKLEKSYKFYHEGMGLATKGIIGKEFEHGEVVFFELKNGMVLALYSRDNLAWDSHQQKGAPSSTEFSIGYNTRSEAEVDSIMAQAEKAGAVIARPAQKTFWGGYSGYFKDPDGHLWEIVYNPGLIPKD